MEKKPRNPVWSRDELTLALDLYFRTKGNPTAQDVEAVEELSANLNKLHRIWVTQPAKLFATAMGVYLKAIKLT